MYPVIVSYFTLYQSFSSPVTITSVFFIRVVIILESVEAFSLTYTEVVFTYFVDVFSYITEVSLVSVFSTLLVSLLSSLFSSGTSLGVLSFICSAPVD